MGKLVDLYLEDKISPCQWLITRLSSQGGYESVVVSVRPWDPYFGLQGPAAHPCFRVLQGHGYMGGEVVYLAQGMRALADALCRHQRELHKRTAKA